MRIPKTDSDQTAKADFSLRWVHMSVGMFSYIVDDFNEE